MKSPTSVGRRYEVGVGFEVISVKSEHETEPPFGPRTVENVDTGEEEPVFRVRLELRDPGWDEEIHGDPPKIEILASKSSYEAMTSEDFADVVRHRIHVDMLEAIAKGLAVIWGTGINDGDDGDDGSSYQRPMNVEPGS